MARSRHTRRHPTACHCPGCNFVRRYRHEEPIKLIPLRVVSPGVSYSEMMNELMNRTFYGTRLDTPPVELKDEEG